MVNCEERSVPVKNSVKQLQVYRMGHLNSRALIGPCHMHICKGVGNGGLEWLKATHFFLS